MSRRRVILGIAKALGVLVALAGLGFGIVCGIAGSAWGGVYVIFPVVTAVVSAFGAGFGYLIWQLGRLVAGRDPERGI